MAEKTMWIGDPTHRLFVQITQVSVRLLTQIERVDGHYNNESLFAFDSMATWASRLREWDWVDFTQSVWSSSQRTRSSCMANAFQDDLNGSSRSLVTCTAILPIWTVIRGLKLKAKADGLLSPVNSVQYDEIFLSVYSLYLKGINHGQIL